MMHYYYGYGFHPFYFPSIFSIIFWVFVVVLLIALFSHSHDEKDSIDEDRSHEENSNLEIIKERYAKGEIKRKEYEQLKKDLA